MKGEKWNKTQGTPTGDVPVVADPERKNISRLLSVTFLLLPVFLLVQFHKERNRESGDTGPIIVDKEMASGRSTRRDVDFDLVTDPRLLPR